MSDSYTYWAFISYSHHDRRVARWLRKALESRRVPRRFRGLIDRRPRRFRPIYLDEEEASASAQLSQHLRDRLAESRSLIVICSPFAVGSEIVAEEIRYFQSLGRSDRIVCLLASGVPNAADEGKPALECFPEPLRFSVGEDGEPRPVPIAERPLAASIGAEQPAQLEHALHQVTAGLLGVPVSEYLGLFGRRRRLRRLAVAGVCVALLATILGAWDLYGRKHVSYYEDYVRRWGVWEGVGELSSEQASRRAESYRFERRGHLGSVHLIALVNGSGTCPEDGLVDILGRNLTRECSEARACTVALYIPDGAIKSESYLDHRGNTLQTLSYHDPSVGTFVEGGFGCARTKSGVEYVRFTRVNGGPNEGLNEQIDYLSGEREPRVNPDGVYSVRYRYDENGRRTETRYLDPGGGLAPSKEGVAGFRSEYVEGREAAREYFDAKGSPVASADGWVRLERERDEHGNTIRVRHFDANGRAAMDKTLCAEYRYEYDQRGNEVRVTCLDAAGRLSLTRHGHASEKREFDSDGYETARSFFDAAGEPTMIRRQPDLAASGGAWRQEFRTNNFGETVEVAHFGRDGAPAYVQGREGGYSIRRMRFDDRSNVVEEHYFNGEGEPIVTRSGWASVLTTYDERGRRIRVEFLGPEGRPVRSSDGNASWRVVLDNFGNAIETQWFGVNGEPVPNSVGCWILSEEHDENGNAVAQYCLDADRNRVRTRGGSSIVRPEYDRYQRLVEKAFYDLEDQPTTVDGIFRFNIEYDDRGNQVALDFYDTGGNRTLHSEAGYAALRFVFDSRDRAVLYTRLDTELELIAGQAGVMSSRIEYDDSDREVGRRFLGASGEPAPNSGDGDEQGHYGVDQTLDPRGNVVESRLVGRDGELVRSTATDVGGWAVRRKRFDERDRNIEESYYDELERPTDRRWGIFKFALEYDELDRQTERRFYGADGELVLSSGSTRAIVRTEYDPYGRVTKESSFGLEGEPVNRDDEGWSVKTVEYDHAGEAVKTSYFDKDGAPVQVEE